MKVFDLFTKVFTVFAFLTLGSLLIMVSLHVVAWDDLMRDLGRIYEDPRAAFQTLIAGIFFIFMGLAFAKILIKQTRYAGGIIYAGPLGRTTVSVSAVEDVVRKTLKRFPEILTFTLKCRGYEKKAEIKVKLVVQAGVTLPVFSDEVKKEIRSRLERLLNLVNDVEVFVNVRNIKDSESYEALSARKAS
ncbi:MAG: alkaline shock response membrane anchor protein AmaP [Candidatus Omnitrophica bacterium]|nr:alkaline shock response membrane anchor protein AmaP [Candidatus Omnitrophota bacterium]